MNFLAHSLLADHPDDVGRIGGILGDLLKSGAGLPPPVQREMLLHRAIDSFTDSHRIVLSAKALFRKQTRRYAGILLDVFYDYCLVPHWSSYASKPLALLIDQTYAGLLQYRGVYPPHVAVIVERLVNDRLLESYQSFEGVERAIIRTSKRLSRGGEAMIDGINDLRVHAPEIMAGFNQFFPELIEFSRRQRSVLIEQEFSSTS